jgi:ankyrin repeat protein
MHPVILDPNYQGPFGNTLLHGAVLINDRKEVERLLAAGADPRIANREGRTAIHIAVLLGLPGLYELLARDHLEQLLDQALEATFPASDPVAVTPASRTRL